MKRKRKSKNTDSDQVNKKQKKEDEAESQVTRDHPVLKKLYGKVVPLREYILSQLPDGSKRKRTVKARVRQIKHGGIEVAIHHVHDRVCDILDGCVVGVQDKAGLDKKIFKEQFQQFSSQLSELTGTPSPSFRLSSQAELVDFVIWVLFHKTYAHANRPPHLLCHGTQRASAVWQNQVKMRAKSTIPGLASMFPNEYVETLKSPSWAEVTKLMGGYGERILFSLFVNHAIFAPVKGAAKSYYQISGTPVADLPPLMEQPTVENNARSIGKHNKSNVERNNSSITFVRHRMLYAKAGMNAKREVSLGLRHIHVFNRFPRPEKPEHTVHIMKYLFPRQFGLHNVFTSKVDTRETAHQFKDYTLREPEIAQLNLTKSIGKFGRQDKQAKKSSLPRRLRGAAFEIIQKLQRFHSRCAYVELLNHYCPRADLSKCDETPLEDMNENEGMSHFTRLATPTAHVSAFCQAVFSNVFPHELFGESNAEGHNVRVLKKHIDGFLKARRFESFTLENVMYGIKISPITWMESPKSGSRQRMSWSDFLKRSEMMSEIVYYVFDSFFIPLIRSNFYVTESNVNRNRLFYFRQDVWRRLTEPSLTSIKSSMLEQMKTGDALKMLNSRTLGFSYLRLLPKEKGMRSISNLRRRTQIIKNGRGSLGRSINSIMTPAYHVLKYEKANQPLKIGSSLFSVDDIYDKVRSYRQTLQQIGLASRRLYFAKVDVTSCFDNLPQSRVLNIVRRLISSDEYDIARYTELRSLFSADTGHDKSKPLKKFHAEANAVGNFGNFEKRLRMGGKARKLHVFSDSVIPQTVKTEQAMSLMTEHILNNIVKIGKKFYRQRRGVPQGSILSTILCNFCYAAFEEEYLGFVSVGDSLLLRLIDDFLLITPDRQLATRFVEVMHVGSESYGVSVKPEKSLVNFDTKVEDQAVTKLQQSSTFPFCGMLLDQQTLEITKDEGVIRRGRAQDALTAEYSKMPGNTFRRKMTSAVKIQMHTMLFDMSHNAPTTVLGTLYKILTEAASRSFYYLKCVRNLKRTFTLLRHMVKDLAALVFAKIRSKRNKARCPQYKCSIGKETVRWLTSRAFKSVFERRQAGHADLVKWLECDLERRKGKVRRDWTVLQRIVRDHDRVIKGHA